MTSIDNQTLIEICKHIATANLALSNPNLPASHRACIEETLAHLHELRISLLEAKHS